MHAYTEKTIANKNQDSSIRSARFQNTTEPSIQFIDNRAEAVAQRKLQRVIENSPQANRAAQMQAIADKSSTCQPKKHLLRKKDFPN
jgi:hypothetical protein